MLATKLIGHTLPLTRRQHQWSAVGHMRTFATVSFANPAELKPRRPAPPPLPEVQSVLVDGKCVIKYFDVKPDAAAANAPTFVLLHGAPGTYKDFRYLAPLLSRQSARVIGVNLPGFGGSDVVNEADYFELANARAASSLTYDALCELCKRDEHVFLLGHSFGGLAAVDIAELNADATQKLNVKGMILLASAGHRPHRSLFPRVNNVVVAVLRAKLPVIDQFIKKLIHITYTKIAGFPDNSPTSHYVSGLLRAETTEHENVGNQLKRLEHIPAFVAWAKDDVHVEEDISLKMSQECPPGPRFAFEKGGHNIQKTKAEFLAEEIHRWVNEITDGSGSDKTRAYPVGPVVRP
uniref:AB hydrolase-1 domain-containing protein n=1 Tax=Globisporangium ultimum (strain ATCC 200006 / CBS 805.95 / DAOM BR144) TaxID=431595 RepID=K3X736_GLOUD